MSSTQCRHFVQNAWKKELCSNCFKPKEEHAVSQNDQVSRFVTKTAAVRRVALKVQGILRAKDTSSKIRSKRKNVVFPDTLTEIIGYDGGDDFGSDGEDDHPDSLSDDADSGFPEVDDIPDSEEERALGNLTRANTNFNTVTANLTNDVTPDKGGGGKGVMLGRMQKDNEGKKAAPLLVSVTPFGGDDSLPTARRPVDKKSPEIKTAKSIPETPSPKPVVEASPKQVVPKKLTIVTPEPVVKAPEPKAQPTSLIGSSSSPSSLGKIVDMPLITSTNLISVMRNEEAQSEKSERRPTSIARTPAIKKTENEKPRIVAQQTSTKDMVNGVELNLSPVRTTETAKFNKETTTYKSNLADLTERKVEGEAAIDKVPFEETRESAGEPDGKADEEVVSEPPALPKSPPPLDTGYTRSSDVKRLSAEPRTSFLHGINESSAASTTKPKPVIPQKPAGLPSPTKAIGSSLASLLSENRAYEFRLSQLQNAHSQSETQLCEDKPKRLEPCNQMDKIDVYKAVCVKTSGDSSEQTTSEDPSDEDDSETSGEQPRKRQAPQPPTSPDTANLFTRNPKSSDNSTSPCVREKEKREQRASSCSPKFRKNGLEVCESPAPEPVPRRNISLSQDSLAYAAGVPEEKKKGRSKFSLKKFLRMGTRRDVDMTCSNGSRSDEIPSTPQPKPRLEIIHPLELDGAAVQVVRSEKSEDTVDIKIKNHSTSPTVHSPQHVAVRPTKPPPPPRTQSLDESSKPRTSPLKQQTNNSGNKSLVGKSWQPSGNSSGGSSASDSIYANLAAAEDVAGAMRSGLAPAKPRRTSSMRDQISNSTSTGSQLVSSPAEFQRTGDATTTFKPVNRSTTTTDADSSGSSESPIYENSSSTVDRTDSGLELRRQGSGNHPVTKRQSDSVALGTDSAELKFQQTLFTRSTSLPYCGSETDSEIYSPFSYYNGDESFDDSQEWKKEEGSRIGRLRQRRGRSIVHRSLEDNYGAVIVANHEALAQFLEQMNQQLPPLSSGLRALKTSRLQFQDFAVDKSTAVVTGQRIYLSACWSDNNLVTLCVAFEPSVHTSRKEFYLTPIVEFIDTVTQEIAEIGKMSGRKNLEATISVLPRVQVNTLESFAELMSSKDTSGSNDEAAIRESSFVLLQLVSALKSLQARGIEEAPGNLSNVVLCREDKDAYHKLYIYQGLNIDSGDNNGNECVSLCQCALNALDKLNLATKLPLIKELLMREKAVTLSQVKSILEFSLWGPSDATLGGPRERETALQRWLDLERATVLHALVRARAQLTVTDEYQLLFLVRTSAKIMCEASLLLDKQRNGLLGRG